MANDITLKGKDVSFVLDTVKLKDLNNLEVKETAAVKMLRTQNDAGLALIEKSQKKSDFSNWLTGSGGALANIYGGLGGAALNVVTGGTSGTGGTQAVQYAYQQGATALGAQNTKEILRQTSLKLKEFYENPANVTEVFTEKVNSGNLLVYGLGFLIIVLLIIIVYNGKR